MARALIQSAKIALMPARASLIGKHSAISSPDVRLRAWHGVRVVAMMKIFLGILVFAAVGVILAAIKRDWLALGIYVIGLLVNIALGILVIQLPAAQ